MAEKFAEVQKNINGFLLGLRQSVERPFLLRGLAVDEQRERFMRTIIIIEEARIRFNTYARYREEEPTGSGWDGVCKELLLFVDQFAHSDFVDPKIYDKIYRFRFSPIGHQNKSTSAFMEIFTDRENRMSISEALVRFRNYLENLGNEFVKTQDPLSLEDLDRIVPQQQVAPIQFDIVDGRIVVASRAPKTAEADRANIQSALGLVGIHREWMMAAAR